VKNINLKRLTHLAIQLKFILKFGFLFLCWKILFYCIWRNDYLFEQYNDACLVVISHILIHVKFILSIIGEQAEIITSTRIVKIIDTLGVTVGTPCIGIKVSAAFIGLILSYGDYFKQKISFIIIGTTLIYSLNLMRITLLTLMVKINPYLWELNHKYIFKIIIYAVVFALWIAWINKTKNIKRKQQLIADNN
jgi:exosortase/archaeosortase family protein